MHNCLSLAAFSTKPPKLHEGQMQVTIRIEGTIINKER